MASPSKRAKAQRTNAEITAETRDKLIGAGRAVFAAHGFRKAGGEEVVAMAGVTRGALYYQFGGMEGLFAATAETVAGELARGLYERTMAALPQHGQGNHSVEELEIGADLLLKAFATGDAADLLLREAPVVMGHQGWQQLMTSSGLRGLLDHALEHWIEARILPAKQKAATADVIFGALMQAGIAIAAADNRGAALQLYRDIVRRMIRALRDAKGV
jgi:AcrR family transcriptional regulator